jgi:hypothetical protein
VSALISIVRSPDIRIAITAALRNLTIGLPVIDFIRHAHFIEHGKSRG